MLSLRKITKDYVAGDTKVTALKGIDIDFRESEFVSILGPSGCGKTTLLNIIGGLDKYTLGDLIINGKSTTLFRDRDWDTYRNHSIGFVFQSYNLIPHQTVLANVELALTLSGVSKAERRERAKQALISVGLGDQLHKKPNQMSGGQMQRVAIARALVNDPDILLADEPTGALDSETSVQIMEILKEISKDKLIIMVTHNPELAERYSSRIIRLLDGEVKDDTNPYVVENDKLYTAPAASEDKTKKKSMSFFTALSLSFNNLLTKKARTFLTSFAGSIGIIGIALILAISSGINAYISKVQEDTLSSYPLQIEKNTVDISSLMTSMMGENENAGDHGTDKIYSNDVMCDMMSTMISEITTNDLKAFKEYIESGDSDIKNLTNDIQYTYATQLNVYKADTSAGVVKVNPSDVMERMGFQMGSNPMMSENSMMSNTSVWTEMLSNDELIDSQYDIVAGKLPKAYDEVVLIVSENNEISDYTLYSLGIKDKDELAKLQKEYIDGKTEKPEQTSYTYDDILNLRFKLIANSDYYKKDKGIWVDCSDDDEYMEQKIKDADEIKVVGIIRPKPDASATAVSNDMIGYRAELMQHLVNKVNDSQIVKEQKENEKTDVFTGKPFKTGDETAQFDMNALDDEQKAYFATLSEEEQQKLTKKYMSAATSEATYDDNLSILGVADLDNPNGINIYPKDFASKEKIQDIIEDYNNSRDEEYKIEYTDYMGLLLSGVTVVINAISYVLIAFVAISLIVSSIMIGIITYISVLERTKEIGVLRSIGASKKDVSRVFNAETLIVGFVAGMIGIGFTLLISLPINVLIKQLTDISNVAALPIVGAVVLVCISMLLTFIAGLIPAKIAAKKDPVIALRSE